MRDFLEAGSRAQEAYPPGPQPLGACQADARSARMLSAMTRPSCPLGRGLRGSAATDQGTRP